MNPQWTCLVIFVLAYALFTLLPHWRAWIACAACVLLVAGGAMQIRHAVVDLINWNVIALTFGTFLLAELFMQSRAPAVLAEWLVDRMRTARAALVAVCLLSGALSVAVANVAVVTLVAPVALSLAEKLAVSPVPVLICVALSANLQGSATLIGDPPSMILASHMKLSFNDFFVYQGRPGIFFAIQAGALASAVVIFWFFRKRRERVVPLHQEQLRSWVPALLMLALVVGLALSTTVDPSFRWFAGVYATALGLLGLAWAQAVARWSRATQLLKNLDWNTLFFLAGVFVLVGALSGSGWLARLATGVTAVVGGNLVVAFAVIVVVSVVLSGFVDNVPFLLAMIPVADTVAKNLHAPVPLLMFGLLLGTCLGGNLTPVGASANVVVTGILRKHGHTVGMREFLGYGLPFTVATVLAACGVVWWVWAP